MLESIKKRDKEKKRKEGISEGILCSSCHEYCYSKCNDNRAISSLKCLAECNLQSIPFVIYIKAFQVTIIT
jgi:hypothetical protein